MAKKTKTINRTLAANESVNVLSGTRFENVEAAAFLLIAAVADADGIEVELFVSSRNSIERSPVGVQSGPPILPDDVIVDEVECFQGEKIQLQVHETAGVATTTFQAKLILDDNVGFAG